MTTAIRDFAARLQMGAVTADKVKRTFAGVFAVLKIGWDIIKGVTRYFFSLFSIVGSGSGGILSLTAAAGDFLVKIAGWINASGGIKKFFDGLIKAKENILQPLVDTIAKVVDAFSSLFSGDTSGFIDKLMSGFSNIGNVVRGYQENISNMFGKVSIVAAWISAYLAKLNFPAPIVDTFSYIATLFDKMRKNFNLDFIVNIIDAISQKFQDLRNNINSGNPFAGIINNIKIFIDNIKKLRDSFSTDSLPKFDLASFKMPSVDLSGVSSAGSGLKKIWDGLTNALSNIGAAFAPITARIGAFFDVISAKVLEYIKGMSFQDGVALLNTGFFIAMYIALTKFLKSMQGVFNSASKMLNNLGDVFKQLGKSLKTMQQDVKANIILKIAIAVAILAGAVYVLSKIPAEGLKKALIALTVMFTELGIILVAFSKINTGPSSLAKTSVGLILLAIAVKILAGAVKELSGIGWVELAKGLVGVGGLLVALTLFSKFASAEKGGASSGVGLVMLAIAIKILVTSISTLGKMDTGVLIKGIISLGVMLVLLAGIVKAFNNTKGIIQAAVGMLILAGALLALSFAIKGYAKIDSNVFSEGLKRIAIALAAIALAMRVMPTNVKSIAGSLLVVSIALLVLSGVLKIMGSMDIESIGRSMLALGGSLAIITAALFAFSKIKGGMETSLMLIVLSKALVIMAVVLTMLSKLSWQELEIGLAGLAGMFVILVAAGWLLKPVVGTLEIFAHALLILGAAMFVAGAGMTLFAAGLAILAVSGAVGFGVLLVGFQALINMIPLFAQQVGLGMIAIAKVMGDSSPILLVAFTKILLAMLKAFVAVTPPFVKSMIMLIKELILAAVSLIPDLIKLGLLILVSFLQGIANNIQAVVVAAVKIVTEFINGLTNSLPKLVTAGVNFIVTLVKGIVANIGTIIKAGSDLLVAFLSGITLQLPTIIATGAKLIVAFLTGIIVALPSIIAAGAKLIVAFLTGITVALPSILVAGANLIIAFINGIAQQLPWILLAVGNLIVAFLSGITINLPRIITAGANLIIAFLNGIASNLPGIIAAVANLIVQFLLGIAAQIPNIIAAGVSIIVAFIKGIADSGVTIVNAAADAIITFINGLSDAIDSHAEEVGRAAGKLMVALGAGLKNGLGGAIREVANGVGGPMGFLLGKMADALGVASPSTKTAKMGRYLVDGLAIGLNKHADLTTKAASNVGHSAIEAMRKSISGMDSLLPSDTNINPTITPVLDLTNVQKDALGIDSMLNTKPLAVASTYSTAQNVSAGYNANPGGSVQTSRDIKALTTAIGINSAPTDQTSVPPVRPVEFHIGTVQDGDSLLRRARATGKMLSLAEGGDSPQIVGIGI